MHFPAQNATRIHELACTYFPASIVRKKIIYFRNRKVDLNSVQSDNDTPATLNLTARETDEVQIELTVLEKNRSKRGKYNKWTGEERAEIAQCANENGVRQNVRLLNGKYPRLSKQTVCDFKKAFNEAKRNTTGEVDEIRSRKRGCPTLLPEELMQKTIETIQALRLKGAPVTAPVINAIANDRTILVEHGGYLSLSYDWAKAVLNRTEKEGKKMTRRMATTAKIPVAPGLLKEAKLGFQRDIKTLQTEFNVPEDLILNFDQTPLTNVTPRVIFYTRKARQVFP